jgi:hypothetical protein
VPPTLELAQTVAIGAFDPHHRTLNLELARKAQSAEEQIAQAREAAERFGEDFQVSRDLLRSLFQMEFPS